MQKGRFYHPTEAEMLRMVCNGVEIEPVLADITAEELNRETKTAPDARLDIVARGSAFFDVQGYGSKPDLQQHQIEKKREYRSLDILISRVIPSNIGQSAASPYINKTQKAAEHKNKNLFFKSALIILTVSTNAFRSTNLFCCFSRCQAPTNNVAPYSLYRNHTQPTVPRFAPTKSQSSKRQLLNLFTVANSRYERSW